MKRVIVALGLAAMMASTANAQTVKEKLGALEEGLNDASPIIRLGTLEEALADSSKAVRTYAMSQALASDDSDMRELAISHFFTTKKSLQISISLNSKLSEKYDSLEDAEEKEKLSRNESKSFDVAKNYSPSIIYSIKSFDPDSGEISGFCMKDMNSQDSKYKVLGVLTGDKLSFEHSCRVNFMNDCSINLELSDGVEFLGSMQCNNENYPSEAVLALK